ncbi:MAG: eCIS core domain-containing protein [Pseudonocardiaceae bacterium]
MSAESGRVTVPAPRPVEAPVLRRCCGEACGDQREEEHSSLRRSAVVAVPATAPPVVHDVLRSPGQPLDADTRAFMEPRFGHDFSRVRVHADARATAAADAVGARAYTVGQNIAFAAGMYSPGTTHGRRLLAHELTHVVQQGNAGPGVVASRLTVGDADAPAERVANQTADAITAGISPQPISLSGPALCRDTHTSHAGTAVVTDTPEERIDHGNRTWEGRMRRTQYRTQAEADAAGQGGTPEPMDIGWANIRFDGAACQVTIPVKVQIRAATAADIDPALLSNPQLIPVTVDQALVQRVGADYVAACNTALNGWYEVVLENCGNEHCAGRPIPIRVEVTQSTTAPDFMVCVSNLEGRSNVAHSAGVGSPGKVVLFASGLSRGTMAHEGGHMALGLPDEYHESDAALRQRAPLQTGIEREHDDWSIAGSFVNYGRWVLLHQRHFSFVPAFLRAVMADAGHPNCRAVLQALRRPVVPEFRVSSGFGYSSYGRGGFDLGGGFDVGLGLDRLRHWQLFLGVHGQYLMPLRDSERYAFLAGARIGLEHRWNPSGGGLQLGAFGEFGATGEIGDPGLAAPRRPVAPFAGAGARLGYGFAPAGGLMYQLGLEAGGGMRIDPEAARWFRLGLSAGVAF